VPWNSPPAKIKYCIFDFSLQYSVLYYLYMWMMSWVSDQSLPRQICEGILRFGVTDILWQLLQSTSTRWLENLILTLIRYCGTITFMAWPLSAPWLGAIWEIINILYFVYYLTRFNQVMRVRVASPSTFSIDLFCNPCISFVARRWTFSKHAISETLRLNVCYHVRLIES